jgi:hypothetical protein
MAAYGHSSEAADGERHHASGSFGLELGYSSRNEEVHAEEFSHLRGRRPVHKPVGGQPLLRQNGIDALPFKNREFIGVEEFRGEHVRHGFTRGAGTALVLELEDGDSRFCPGASGEGTQNHQKKAGKGTFSEHGEHVKFGKNC